MQILKHYRAALLVFLVADIIGCGGSKSSSVPPPTPPTPPAGPSAATAIYVIQNDPKDLTADASDSILRFDATDTGTVAPVSTITAPAGYFLGSVAVDASGEIYAAGWTTSGTTLSPTTIFVYAAGATGNATPIREILSPVLSGSVVGMAFDSTGQLYVSVFAIGTGYGSVAVFPANADGSNVTPARTLKLDAAQIQDPGTLAVGSDGTIYVSDISDNARIVAFAPDAMGSPLPARSISGANTGIQQYIAAFGLDSSNNLYVSSVDPVTTYGIINVFAATANGNILPTKSIGGKALGAAGGIGGIQVDAVGNVYGVALEQTSGNSVPSFVFSYGTSAKGDVSPQTKFTAAAYSNTLFGTLAVH